MIWLLQNVRCCSLWQQTALPHSHTVTCLCLARLWCGHVQDENLATHLK